MSQVVLKWTDEHGCRQQNVRFTLEDHVSKIIVTKNASNKILQQLKRSNIKAEVIVKE